MKYREAERNHLANCMLLSREENGAGGKSDTLPETWFSGKPESYLDMHLIPRDRDLWKIDRFEDFIEERKRLIREQFSYLLTQKEGVMRLHKRGNDGPTTFVYRSTSHGHVRLLRHPTRYA